MSMHTEDTTMSATPMKLRDGSWGAKVQGTVRQGDTVTITTRGGKSWTAMVSRVVWSGDGVTICATASTDDDGSRHGSYRTIGERQRTRMERTGWTGCSCGSIEGQPRRSDCASCQHDY